MASSDGADVVTLTGGQAVPLAAVRLLWDLQDRGFTLCRVPKGLRVQPTERITAEDDAAIRRYRDELLLLVDCETIQ
jgi:hypothetical protein